MVSYGQILAKKVGLKVTKSGFLSGIQLLDIHFCPLFLGFCPLLKMKMGRDKKPANPVFMRVPSSWISISAHFPTFFLK